MNVKTSLFLLIFFSLVLLHVPVWARNSATIDMEISSIEALIELLEEQILFEQTRSRNQDDQEDMRSQEIDNLLKRIAQEQASLAELEELESFTNTQAAKIKKASGQLETYIQELRRLQKQNVIKTLITMGIETAQVISDYASLSGNLVKDVGNWAAGKAAGKVVEELVGEGPEYYERSISGLLGDVRNTTPELEKLGEMTRLSLEGWQSYLHKHEGKDIQGSTATILAKARVILEQAEKARQSLIQLEHRLENTAKGTEAQIWAMRDKIEQLQSRVQEIESQEDVPESVFEEKIQNLKQEIADLHEVRSQLLQEKAELEEREDRDTKDHGIDVETAVALYKEHREKYLEELPGYQERAVLLGKLLNEVPAPSLEELIKKYRKELDKITKDNMDKPMYPDPTYLDTSGSQWRTVLVSDSEGLQNYKSISKLWVQAMQKHEQRLLERLNSSTDHSQRLLEAFTSTPHDPNTEAEQRSKMNGAYAAAGNAIKAKNTHIQEYISGLQQRLNQATNNDSREAYHRMIEAQKSKIQELENIKEGLFNLHQKVSYDPFTGIRTRSESFLKHRYEQGLHQMQQQLQDFKNEIEGYERMVQEKIPEYEQEIAEKRSEYEIKARTFIRSVPPVLNAIDQYVNAVNKLNNLYRQQASRGLLEENSHGGFILNKDWIPEFVSDTPKNCKSIELILKEVRPLSDRADELLATAGRVRQMAFTTPGAPNSGWSEVNVPGLHSQVAALQNELTSGREKLTGVGHSLPPNHFAGLIQGFFTNATLMSNSPDIFQEIQNTYKDLSFRIKHNIDFAVRMEQKKIMHEEDLVQTRELVQVFSDRYNTELSCLGDDFSLNVEVLRLLEELESAVNRLDRTKVYADASKLLSELRELYDDIRALPMGHTSEYYNLVRYAISRFENVEQEFEDNKKSFADQDAQAARELLFEISEQLRYHRQELASVPEPGINQKQIKTLYQEFINAYGRGDVRGVLRLMADDWQGGDGSDIYDVENYLNNSFRVFERIQYRISGFSAQPAGENLLRVNYNVRIVGENRRQRLSHEENVRVVEEVGLVDGEPRILRTISGSQWIK